MLNSIIELQAYIIGNTKSGRNGKINHATLLPSHGDSKVEQGQNNRSFGTIKEVTQYCWC